MKIRTLWTSKEKTVPTWDGKTAQHRRVLEVGRGDACGVYVSLETQYKGDDGEWRFCEEVFGVYFHWWRWKWGPEHGWYDGPHCTTHIGPFHINHDNPHCKKCLGEA